MTASDKNRAPRSFPADDPRLTSVADAAGEAANVETGGYRTVARSSGRPTAGDVKRGFAWGATLVSAMLGLAAIAALLAFARFVSTALERDDWIGWLSLGLLGIAGLAAAVLGLREVIGLLRLRRLTQLKSEIVTALATKDVSAERTAAMKLRAFYAGRPDVTWGLARLKEHGESILAPGELLALADRDLMVPLDAEARRVVLASAKRVSVVTAMSPMAWLAMLFVGAENVRLLRILATLYGGRPGLAGALRLAKLVIGHIVATGGVAMTDDLLGQFLGQDVLRRLSRRLGEGAFNGALTARLGTAAIEVVRPLPFIDTKPVRARDLLPELLKPTGDPQPEK